MVDISDRMLYRIDILNQQNTRVNFQMSTGKVLDKGSDDSRVYTNERYIEDKLRTYEGLKIGLEKNNAQNDVADSTLAEIKNLLDYIKTETIKGRNDTNDATSRAAIATQIEGARDNIFTLVNEKVEDEYIFSGSQTSVEAFTKNADGKITYNGNPNLRTTAVEVDSYRERGVTGFDIMSYNVTTAVAGQSLEFKEGERIIDEQGFEWKLNTTNSVLVRYDDDGKATEDYVEVTTTGESPDKIHTIENIGDIEGRAFTVKHNTFDVIDDVIKALNSNDPEGISLALENLNSAYNAANHAHGELGGRNATFEASYERITSKITHFNILMTENSQADMAKVAMEAKSLEMTYTALYSTISKMNSLSLVNFVR